MHVSDVGEWEGHSVGPFALTRDAFVQCIEAMRTCETPAPVDYDHSSLRPLDGQPTPAAGYILDLSIRDDGLYALVEFTQRAAEMVRAGEYRFCSGVFVWDAADRKTGDPIPCQLDSIGLTNKPFIDGQHAIRLSRRALGASMEIAKKDLMAKLDALVSGPTVTAAEIKALVDFLEKSAEPEASEPPEAEEPKIEVEAAKMPCSAPSAAPLAAPPMSPAPMAEAPIAETAAIEADGAAMLLTKIAELTGLDSASILASLEANSDRIKAAFLGGDGGTVPYQALSAKVDAQAGLIATLSAEVEQHRKAAAERADAEIVTEVEKHIAAGRIVAGNRETMLALARKAPAEFKALAAALPARVPMGVDAPAAAATANSSAIGMAVIDKTHPRYRELHTHYSKSWGRSLTPAQIEAAVINIIAREQPPISG